MRPRNFEIAIYVPFACRWKFPMVYSDPCQKLRWLQLLRHEAGIIQQEQVPQAWIRAHFRFSTEQTLQEIDRVLYQGAEIFKVVVQHSAPDQHDEIHKDRVFLWTSPPPRGISMAHESSSIRALTSSVVLNMAAFNLFSSVDNEPFISSIMLWVS